MDLTQLSKAVKILKDSACTELFLFGSQANGKATAFSDVDLGVRGLPSQCFFSLHFDLERALNMKVDLVDFDYQKDFYELLKKHGELKKIG